MKNYLLNSLEKLVSVYHAARQFFKQYSAGSSSDRFDGDRSLPLPVQLDK
jgi:hypothetical protein